MDMITSKLMTTGNLLLRFRSPSSQCAYKQWQLVVLCKEELPRFQTEPRKNALSDCIFHTNCLFPWHTRRPEHSNIAENECH